MPAPYQPPAPRRRQATPATRGLTRRQPLLLVPLVAILGALAVVVAHALTQPAAPTLGVATSQPTGAAPLAQTGAGTPFAVATATPGTPNGTEAAATAVGATGLGTPQATSGTAAAADSTSAASGTAAAAGGSASSAAGTAVSTTTAASGSANSAAGSTAAASGVITATPAAASNATSVAQPNPPYVAYTVQAGDTLATIGAKYNVPPLTIARASGLSDPNMLRQGQVLTVPKQAGTLVRVQPGESMDQIAARYGRSVDDLEAANDMQAASVQAGYVLLIPDPTPTPPASK